MVFCPFSLLAGIWCSTPETLNRDDNKTHISFSSGFSSRLALTLTGFFLSVITCSDFLEHLRCDFTMLFHHKSILVQSVGALFGYLLLCVNTVLFLHLHTDISTQAAPDWFFFSLVKWGIIIMGLNHRAKNGSSRVCIHLPSSYQIKPTCGKCAGFQS